MSLGQELGIEIVSANAIYLACAARVIRVGYPDQSTHRIAVAWCSAGYRPERGLARPRRFDRHHYRGPYLLSPARLEKIHPAAINYAWEEAPMRMVFAIAALVSIAFGLIAVGRAWHEFRPLTDKERARLRQEGN